MVFGVVILCSLQVRLVAENSSPVGKIMGFFGHSISVLSTVRELHGEQQARTKGNKSYKTRRVDQ